MIGARFLILCGFFLLGTVSGMAQSTFTVLSVKGQAEYRKGKSAAWQPLTVGQELSSKDGVRTSLGSLVRLLQDKKRIVSVDEKRTASLSSFSKGKGTNGAEASVSGLVMSYASDQLRKLKETKSSKAGASVFGAVRGSEPVFRPVFPRASELTTTPTFWWVDSQAEGEYTLSLRDKAHTLIYQTTLKDPRLAYHPPLPPLVAGQEYSWTVTRAGDETGGEPVVFQVLAADTILLIQKEQAQLRRQFAEMKLDENTCRFLEALYLEKRGVYSEACALYTSLVKAAPEVQEYRDMLRNLLVTLKFYDEIPYIENPR